MFKNARWIWRRDLYHTKVAVGKHCVIGANAVVTHDIPDYCVVVGIPAKVIKKHDMAKKNGLKFSL